MSKQTKTIVLGAKTQPQPKLNKIEFNQAIAFHGAIISATFFNAAPNEFNYIELVCKNYGKQNTKSFDLMFAYYDPRKREKGILYLGHWNDGVV